MKVAVTGAAGFVGMNLVNALVEDGHAVTAIDHGVSKAAAHDGVTWVDGDVLDAEAMRAALRGHELVFHLVAKITLRTEDPDAWRLNTVGVRTVAEAALDVGVRRFIHCSSVHSFDTANTAALDEHSPRSTAESGLPLYDRSKFAGELELGAVIDRGLDAVICNPTGIFGPVDHPRHLSRMNAMLRDAAAGKVPADVTGGFDWVDARDVARGLILAAERGRTGENYLLGGDFITIHEMFARAANDVGRRGPLFSIPVGVLAAIMPIAEPIGEWLGSDIMSGASVAALRSSPRVDHGKATAELGYRARSADETIRDLIMSFVQLDVLDRKTFD